MNKPQISILVPIYKVESYLNRCINSVLIQDFVDWELILVDDGSPDNCPKICDEYAKKDSRIIVVHKKNGGLPSARLAGFKKVKGRFIVFLDADDYLLPNALSILVEKMSEGYDMVRSMVMREDNLGNRWIEHYPKAERDITNANQYQKEFILNDLAPYLHSAMYKASLFDENAFLKNIENSISVGEDWITNLFISHRVNNYGYVESPTCVYCLNTESMINTSIRAWDYSKRVKNAIGDYCIMNVPYELQQMSEKKSLLDKLQYFFMPEIPFNWIEYRLLKPKVVSVLRSHIYPIKKSYTYFVNYGLLFFIYTRLYCFIYKYVKLKGRKRKEIK